MKPPNHSLNSTPPHPGAEPRIPSWRWLVLIVGWVSVIVLAMSPFALKGGSNAETLVVAMAAGTCAIGTLVYAVGRRLWFSQYSVRDLRFVFSPMILGVVIVVGVVLSITVAAVLAR